ncbi:SIR2 family NAD-dependent protein deacylase [Dyella flagellata]|uniref:protein acetyllysine N-acetyltransferase n=1 Tax=Dyella flagellata TaxID=1867833 RepID=A0ABQ5X9S2_9GAMM|nr:NAD-dependent deacylase [Dyella flagellata]GLQ87285.1 NAD-dependent protein deacylase [Dyella flagellata]
MTDKLVFLTGAGVSAESGLKTFRDMGGLWNEYAIEDVASPEAWRKNPATVLSFYNERRCAVLDAKPNAAHLAIAGLEQRFDVVVITQNIDDLHERAGSTSVIHVHGEILKARSTIDAGLFYRLQKSTIELGDLCEQGSQLRPDVVWFGENVRFMSECEEHLRSASRVVVVGTSLTVYPAAGLVQKAPFDAEKYLVSPEPQKVPYGFRFLRGPASTVVPRIATCWLEGRKPV